MAALSVTSPAGKMYVAPVGIAPVEDAQYYIGQTDGADLEVQPLTDERWAGMDNGIVLDDVFVYGSDWLLTVRCIEPNDPVMEMGLLADASTAGGVTTLQPRASLLTGGRYAVWHIPAQTTGRRRALHIRKALALPNGAIRIKRGSSGEMLQIVELRFRVLSATPPWTLSETL